MKKHYFIVVLAILLIGLSACSSGNREGKENNTEQGKASEGLSFVFDHETQGYAVSGIGTCRDIDIVIPSSYDGYPVTSIASANYSALVPVNDAFRENQYIRSITVPGSVQSIGAYSFHNCTGLQTVTLAEGLKKIETNAFFGCTALTKISLPSTVETLDDEAFFGCTALMDIGFLPDSLVSLGSGVFRECIGVIGNEYENGVYFGFKDNPYAVLRDVKDKSAETFTFHPDTKVIDSFAFHNCVNLRSISIPEGVERINRFACSQLSLDELHIPSSISTISTMAFDWCRIDSVYISDIVKWCGLKMTDGNNLCNYGIGTAYHYFFNGKELGTELVIPEGVTVIPENVFSGWLFESISFPSSLHKIEAGAFSNCRNIREITIPEGVTTIGSGAFSGCSSLKTVFVPESVVEIDAYAFLGNECTVTTPLPEKPDGWHQDWNGIKTERTNVIWSGSNQE